MVVDLAANRKYVFGLPLHRQIDKYRRLGVNVPASTASDWIMKGWQHLTPLRELLKLLVLNQKYLQADESPLKVLDRDHKNGIHQGYMWIFGFRCSQHSQYILLVNIEANRRWSYCCQFRKHLAVF
ncbi:MAG TPA: transposase [Dyadobacter sp.]|jgi:hypothetical protein|nr:transposase [Dyadobacter sp.]